MLLNLAPALVALGASPSVAKARCDTPTYGRIGFRIGTFTVRTASGIRAGKSVVASIVKGCAIREEWTGAVSGRGQGITVYEPQHDQWHMIYADEAGHTLDLRGRFSGPDLILMGDNLTFDGRTGLHRMTWSPQPGGGVWQLWEFSANAGRTWSLVLDGRFTRRR